MPSLTFTPVRAMVSGRRLRLVLFVRLMGQHQNQCELQTLPSSLLPKMKTKVCLS